MGLDLEFPTEKKLSKGIDLEFPTGKNLYANVDLKFTYGKNLSTGVDLKFNSEKRKKTGLRLLIYKRNFELSHSSFSYYTGDKKALSTNAEGFC